MGNFYTELNAANQKHYVLFAAGSGITPIMSIIKTVLWKEPNSRCTLLYGNKDANSIIFKAELDQLAAANPSRLDVHHFLSRGGASDDFYGGRIDAAKAREALSRFVPNAAAAEHFICGPEQMIFSIKDELASQGVPAGQVHFELFTTPVETATSDAPAPAAGDFNGTAQVTVIIDGDEVDFEIEIVGRHQIDENNFWT